MKDIVDFLVRAKRATYAGKGAETLSTRPQSHDFVYREEKYMYYDSYLGGKKFSGEEAMWISEKPYWSMNYAGRLCSRRCRSFRSTKPCAMYFATIFFRKKTSEKEGFI